ncbi:DNA-binding transcriptional response regulator, NtrC family, contains REC, AAA-type ATPase, and a Fis-type DNA-binding domains [Nannocystis exedens]|uniref:DNA-binding transcriptional response regulator, NtrC family, contains REC, AAA-type ATPase, and a Fis-type DNA-binding domains n=1 Tax=Nannocystis exedens TaxID=54 RepID=A0A1I1U9V6_9BACT|nr:sigma-54 dependent transcriptional regulator [Nannocystis exedens]PCC71531.1 acetoacetate metabolism regulatory protein AtoC [Nannocystis exedens]SFD67474.1 DNA-binding transcriptional response regulator, NtrC family, contains REC, AAA-type ATPase, and a Fis-type DNA-binding domains [Nannocystis exedens]
MPNPSPAAPRILIVDDEPGARSALSALLREEGYEVQCAADGYKALGRADEWRPDIVLTDVKMPALGGIELLARLRERLPEVAVVVMSGFGSVEGAVEAMQLGADDYLSKPLNFEQVLLTLQRIVAGRALASGVKEARAAAGAEAGADLVGQSRAHRDLVALAGQVAEAPVSLLITGERGAGKQHIARLIHQLSGRPGRLVRVGCSTADEATLNDELFGAEGRVLAAHRGTLLLADVDALPLALQARLLALLQDRCVTRFGGARLEIDVRVIATARHDLAEVVARGRFRQDLADRLQVVSLRVPALRERRDDIPLLATHFVQRHARKLGKSVTGCAERVLQILFGLDWPANVRQLEQCIERAVILTRGREIEPRDLPREFTAAVLDQRNAPVIPGASLWDIERYAILQTLEHTGGSTSKAARILGISARKIQYRLHEYGRTKPGCTPARSADASAPAARTQRAEADGDGRGTRLDA